MKSVKLVVLCAVLGAGSAVVLAQQPPNLENGFKNWGSYEGGSLDTINNLNGNQMLHAPLLPNYPQRGGKLAMQISLYQTSKSWQVGCSVQLNNQVTCQWNSGRAGVSVRVADGVAIQRTLRQSSSGTGQTTFQAFGYTVIDAADTSHQVTGSGPLDTTGESTQFDSIDTSGYHVVMSNPDTYGVMQTATITDRHGNQYIANGWIGGTESGPTVCPALPGNRLPPAPDGGLGSLVEPIVDDAPLGQQDCPQFAYAGQVTDSNGNLISNPELGGTDTLGRTFTFFTAYANTTDYSGCASSHTISSAFVESYTGPDGSTRQVKLCYGNIPINTAFNVSGIADYTGAMSQQLVTVILADGTKWTFDYDSYGEATFVGLPMGGSISYTWTTIAFPSCAIYDGGVSRAVASRSVNDNNGNSYTWHYSWGTVVNSVISNTVTDPLNNDTVHTFTAFDGVGVGACGFYETRTQTYQGTGGSRQLLKQVDTTYSTASYGIQTPYASGLGSVVPTQIQTTVYPSGKVSLVTRQYDSGPGTALPIFGNVTVEKDYDWGQGAPGPLLRETDTTYQGQINSSYLTAHLVDLPATVIVKDGSGCALAETDTTYDEPAYLTGASIGTQHTAPPGPVRGNASTVTHWLAPTSTCNPKGGTAVVSHINWYDTGEVYQQIDPLGHITTHSYDSAYVGAYSTQTCSPATNGGATTHCVSGTYDFSTGVLTSLTNENATAQASGNTPGDSAHTSNYSYDFMWRITSAQAPPDPANGNARAQTTLTYSAPGTFPLSIQQQKSITNALTDSATSFFDGLARSYQSQHVTPGGAATVKTTYDGLGHAASVTNPFYSTADPTYGITTSQYDALGRATQVTKQDGSVSSISYNVVPIQAAPGDCTETQDEAGKQRLTCSDALGRLIEVHEPGDNFSGSQAGGAISISGTLQNHVIPGTNATSGAGSVTIGGNEQSLNQGMYCAQYNLNGDCVDWEMNPPDYDGGQLTITVNGHSDSYGYWMNDTAGTIAIGLANAVNADSGAVVTATASANVVYLRSKANGAVSNYSLSSSYSWYTPEFADPSFTTSNSGAALTGGTNGIAPVTIYDQGTVTATIGSFSASAPYSQSGNSSPQQVASALATSLNAANSPVTATANGTQITLTYKTVGTAGNVTVTSSSQSTQTQWSFSPPSFSGSGTTLAGGYNPGVSLDFNYFVTQYAYDGLGDLLTVTQKGDSAVSNSSQWRIRSFTYDTLGRLLTATNPESGTISYSYDADGNLLQKTSPAPNQTGSATQTISYCYDALSRVTGKGYGAQSCPLASPAVTYTYDAGTNAKGKLTSLTDQAGTASYTYDVLGRMTGESRSIAGITKSMSYAYNLDGSLQKLTYPSNAAVTYTPDSAGRMLSAIDSGNNINYATGATYGPDSGLTGFVSGNSGSFAGITNSFSYNKRLQPVTMSAVSPSATVFSIGYDFHVGNGTSGSDNGNVWGITNYEDATRSQTFTYDPLNRLTSAQNAGTDCSKTTVNGKTEYWGNNYGYDAWGNLLSKTITKCGGENLSVTALANNQLTGYAYDAAGNMTHDATSGLNYVFDQENRITSAAGYTYTYDADGNRVEKSNGSTGTLYWYMSPGIVAESDLSGNLQSEYVFFNGTRVARRDFPGGAVSYYFSDHLKTTDIVTDAMGNIKNESDFYPWGGELEFTANDSNHYKFTGKERDSETGLDYFGARYYSNGMGRFVTPDWAAKPIAVAYADFSDPQTLNLYGYVRDIPTTRFDADGHQGDDDKKPPLPGMVNSPKLSETVEVKAGLCVCAGASGDFGPVTVHAGGEPIGTEIKVNLAGDGETKLNIGKVELGATAGPVNGKVEGGVEISSKDGVSPLGKATVNGAGVKVDLNGVSPVAEASASVKLGGEVKLGAIKGGISLNLSKLAKFLDASMTNIQVIGDAFVQHLIPGAGTKDVGKSPPGSLSDFSDPRKMGVPVP